MSELVHRTMSQVVGAVHLHRIATKYRPRFPRPRLRHRTASSIIARARDDEIIDRMDGQCAQRIDLFRHLHGANIRRNRCATRPSPSGRENRGRAPGKGTGTTAPRRSHPSLLNEKMSARQKARESAVIRRQAGGAKPISTTGAEKTQRLLWANTDTNVSLDRSTPHPTG